MLDKTQKDTDSMLEQARQILADNDRGGYTVPTHGLYPYQWNWDSVLAAWGFASYDLDRGWQEIETLFASQWPTGMVPHIIFHKPDPGYFPGPDVWGTQCAPQTTGITQPPIAATFVRKMFCADRSFGEPRARALFEPLKNWHRWFMDYRSEGGRICITHPWESGRDNAIDWDSAMARVDTSEVGEYTRRDTSHVNPEMRPKKEDYDRYISLLYLGRDTGWDEAQIRAKSAFRVADIGMTFILLRACQDLLWMATELGEDGQEIAGWITQLERGVASMWNEDIQAYDSYDIHAQQFTGCLSNASYLCWYAGIENSVMLEHYQRISAELDYPVPSLDSNNPNYDPLRYWRGPTWPFFNSLIGIGLEDMGHKDEADNLRAATDKLLRTEGFYEYCHPGTGQGAGGEQFTWTAAIWLSWVNMESDKWA